MDNKVKEFRYVVMTAVKVTILYDEAMERLKQNILALYPTDPEKYKDNIRVICGFIIEAFPITDQEIVKRAEKLKGKLNKPENDELKKENEKFSC